MTPKDSANLIVQAKYRLMDALGWDEPMAYRAIQKAAMNQRRTKVAVARDLLSNGTGVNMDALRRKPVAKEQSR